MNSILEPTYTDYGRARLQTWRHAAAPPLVYPPPFRFRLGYAQSTYLLRVSLLVLRVLESNFPEDPYKINGHENSHPLELRVCLSQTL